MPYAVFVYDRAMPDDFLNFLVDAFRIRHEELVPGDKHLNLEDLRHLPNPNHSIPRIERPIPMKLNRLNDKDPFSVMLKRKIYCYTILTILSTTLSTSFTKQCTIPKPVKSW